MTKGKIIIVRTFVVLMLAILISGCTYPQSITKLEKELTIVKLKLEIIEIEKIMEEQPKKHQQQLANQKRIADNLAITLQRLNALINNQNLVDQVNAMLIKNGYQTLIRQEKVVPDSLNNKKEKEK